ncbi:MAG TPA: hypothetical protein VMU69_01090 [Bradyrhizobium sp.]|nr:hypothetical protein [Bradyrhizobium sp.]
MPAFLADLVVAAARFFAAGARLDLAVAVLRADAPEDFSGNFFRTFLDIRLPFVAFDGSTISLLLAVFWQARIE